MTMQALLLHGLAGTPFELQPVAATLQAEGFSVHCPPLPGHGGTVAAYLASSFPQWRDAVRTRYAQLCQQGPVLLGGYSLGGILALDAALWARQEGLPAPAGLLCLATPFFFFHWQPFFVVDWRCFLLPLLARLRPVLQIPPRSAASRAVAPWQGHEGVCSLRHLVQIGQALPAVRRSLGHIRSPLCIIQLRHDRSCPVYNAQFLAEQCRRTTAEVHLLYVADRHGGHLPCTHRESRPQVVRLVRDFARRLLPDADAAGGR